MAQWMTLVFFCMTISQVRSQGDFPQALLFNSKATSITGILLKNDTIACFGTSYKDNDFNSNQQGGLLALIDSCGNLINYHKYFDEAGKDIFITGRKASVKTCDGGYYFGGSLSTLEAFLIKTNHLGELKFYYKYSPPFSTDLYFAINSVIEIEEKLYAFGLVQHDNFDINIFLMKIGSLGEVLYFKEYGSPVECETVSSLYLENNDIVIGAFRSNVLNGNAFAPARNWILKIDTLGSVIWEKIDSAPTKFWGMSGLQRTNDGGWIYGSSHLDSLNPWSSVHYFRCLIVKLDSTFNQQWITTFGNSTSSTNAFVDIVQTNDGGYIAGGTYTTGQSFYNPPPFQKGGVIVKLSTDGDTLWSNFTTVYIDSSGKSSNDLVGLEQLTSGTLITGGGLYNFEEQRNEGWVSKILPSGYTVNDGGNTCEEVSTSDVNKEVNNTIILYPNPFNRRITLENIPEEGGLFRLWSVLGSFQTELLITGNQMHIDTELLSNGFYSWEVVLFDGSHITGKALKL
jgi:hypothetical protein